MIHKACTDISYHTEYNSAHDSLQITYTIKGTRYSMNFLDISDINTTKGAQQFVQMIRSNIDYHIAEQEQII